jgi:hypothetical protein
MDAVMEAAFRVDIVRHARSTRLPSLNMHAAIQLIIYWALAFLTLSAAIVLLAFLCASVENDLELLSFRKEAIIAGIASLVEAAGVWSIVWLIHPDFRVFGLRAMIVPLLIVAVIYKITHLENWSRYELFLLLLFQAAIGCVIASLMLGHIGTAMILLACFAAILVLVIGWAKLF